MNNYYEPPITPVFDNIGTSLGEYCQEKNVKYLNELPLRNDGNEGYLYNYIIVIFFTKEEIHCQINALQIAGDLKASSKR